MTCAEKEFVFAEDRERRLALKESDVFFLRRQQASSTRREMRQEDLIAGPAFAGISQQPSPCRK